MPLDQPVFENEEDDVTLRITREERSGARARLRLEGRLVAERPSCRIAIAPGFLDLKPR